MLSKVVYSAQTFCSSGIALPNLAVARKRFGGDPGSNANVARSIRRGSTRRFAGGSGETKKGDAMNSMRINRKPSDEPLPQLTGEQLLLLTVLGRITTRRLVRQELDRRAIGRAATTC